MKKHLLFFICGIYIFFATDLAVAQNNFFTQTGTIQGHDEAIASIAISPDGLTIAYGTYADNLIRIIDVASMQETRSLKGHTKPVSALAFSPNGQLLASTGTVNLPPGIDGTVRLWNVASGTQIDSVETAPAGMSQLVFSPDGFMLAGASGGGGTLRVSLWDASSLDFLRDIPGVFRMVAFSPDGSRIATGKRDNKVYIMDVATGNEISSFSGHTGWIQAVAFGSDGQTIATGGEDRLIKIRNAQTGQTAQTLTGHMSFPDYLEFSPDASMMASLGSGLNITRTSSGGITLTLSDADKFIRFWDVSKSVEISRLDIGSDIISGVSFNANWQVLVTGSESGLIRTFQWASSSSVLADRVLPTGISIVNYPNPFSSMTTIEYHIEKPGEAALTIYNDLGQPISTLINEVLQEGRHHVVWNAEGLPPGNYYCRLIDRQRTTVHRMLKI